MIIYFFFLFEEEGIVVPTLLQPRINKQKWEGMDRTKSFATIFRRSPVGRFAEVTDLLQVVHTLQVGEDGAGVAQKVRNQVVGVTGAL